MDPPSWMLIGKTEELGCCGHNEKITPFQKAIHYNGVLPMLTQLAIDVRLLLTDPIYLFLFNLAKVISMPDAFQKAVGEHMDPKSLITTHLIFCLLREEWCFAPPSPQAVLKQYARYWLMRELGAMTVRRTIVQLYHVYGQLSPFSHTEILATSLH